MTDPADSPDVMADQAKDRIEDEEGNTFTIQGQSKNPTFIAGGLFHIAHDKTKAIMHRTRAAIRPVTNT